MPSLTVDGARTRAAALSVQSYDVDLDLTQGDRTFGSTTTIRFSASDRSTWVDVKPDELVSATLNGTAIALSRTLIALMESHQDGDGVAIPDVLVQWGAPARLG